jgi:type II secretory pathway component GspD/PulD (secretin)
MHPEGPRVHRIRRLSLLLLLLLCSWSAAAELRVFELRHATPESLLPVVQPMLGPYESVSVYRNSLVVDAGAGTLARVAEALAGLDTPQRNLLISLRRRTGADIRDSGTEVRGTLQQGDVTLTTGTGARGGSGVEVRTVRRSSTREQDGEQSIRALEGSTVLIRDGALVPLATGSVFGPGVGYEALERGFGVRARVQGEEVTLEIETRDDRLEGGEIRTGELVTTVRAPLGEWVALGGTHDSEAESGDGVGSSWSTRSASSAQYEVRVELAP